MPPSNPEGTLRTKDYLSWTWENTLSYNTRINNIHDISAVLGQSMQRESIEGSRITANGFRMILSRLLMRRQWRLTGILPDRHGRWHRYLPEYSIITTAAICCRRRCVLTGSSRFGSNNRWGYFPSVSAGWYLSEESFLKDYTWLDALKLRASYGVSGNFSIGNYDYYASLAADNYVVGTGVGSVAPDFIRRQSATRIWDGKRQR